MDKEIEIERIKMKNYILEKENEILLGTIGILTKEKEEMIKEKEEMIKEKEEIQNSTK